MCFSFFETSGRNTTPCCSLEHLNSKAVVTSKHCFRDFNNMFIFMIIIRLFIIVINCVLLMSYINKRFFRPGKRTIILCYCTFLRNDFMSIVLKQSTYFQDRVY
jgi:hypothetical protein